MEVLLLRLACGCVVASGVWLTGTLHGVVAMCTDSSGGYFQRWKLRLALCVAVVSRVGWLLPERALLTAAHVLQQIPWPTVGKPLKSSAGVSNVLAYRYPGHKSKRRLIACGLYEGLLIL